MRQHRPHRHTCGAARGQLLHEQQWRAMNKEHTTADDEHMQPHTCGHADEGSEDQHSWAHQAADGRDDARMPLVKRQPPRRPRILEPATSAGRWTRGDWHGTQEASGIHAVLLLLAAFLAGCVAAPAPAYQSESTAAWADVQALMPAVMKTVDAAMTLMSWLTRKMLRSRKPVNLPAGRGGHDARWAVQHGRADVACACTGSRCSAVSHSDMRGLVQQCNSPPAPRAEDR